VSTANIANEPVARGLKAIKSSARAGEIPEGVTTLTVYGAHPEVEHHVKSAAFETWVNRPGGSFAEEIQRGRIREILRL